MASKNQQLLCKGLKYVHVKCMIYFSMKKGNTANYISFLSSPLRWSSLRLHCMHLCVCVCVCVCVCLWLLNYYSLHFENLCQELSCSSMQPTQWVDFHSSFFFFFFWQPKILWALPPWNTLYQSGAMSTVCEVHHTNLSSLDKYDKDGSDSPGVITGLTAKQD